VITRAEPETGARLTRGSASNSFAALAQSNRFRIVELLRTGPRSVNNIGERLRLNQSQVSMHLRVLKEAGLVDVRTRARQRFYELRGESLHRLHEWLERYRQLWDAREAKQDGSIRVQE
jgi:DNA-binding transcriptional ArsR family regulator